MQYDEFVRLVQARARLESQGAAVRAIYATFQVLGERLTPAEAAHLAAQLPAELGAYLRSAESGTTFPLGEFFSRVAQHENVDLPDAAHHARIVMDILKEAVSPGVLRHVRDQLPDAYAPLFERRGEDLTERSQ